MTGADRRGAGRDEPPQSPCTNVCVMDDARRYCLGCRRTIDEIAAWPGMDDDAKRAVLAALPARGARSDVRDVRPNL